ncbi:FlgT C-terminal domain-containing protein [Pseudomonas shahriarae]|uniref:FlgT C-terminal domain-containing protein n=1 Tax=Pseudomonas shahriarae TaxID=2745512 RepID=UPI002361B79A|nr:FlgT C-terminal domain-containing protein [Pseudomonas shahriarae]MDD1133181.1 hypothetical protein [Pseudomonas shahriarae]
MSDSDIEVMGAFQKPSVAKIAKVLDEFRVVINIGSVDGVKPGQKFRIYKIGEEILDPDTGEGLGRIEHIKGFGEVLHVQERMATLQTTEKYEVQRRNGLAVMFQNVEVTKAPKEFIDPEIGDLAARI